MNIKAKTDAVTTLRWTREVAAIGGAVTGVTVIWGMMYFNVADATGSRFVGSLAAVVGIVVGLFIIDFSYRRNFPYVADLIVSGQAFKNWRIFTFTFLLLLLSAAQMVSSGLLSWEGRKDVAEGIIKPPELENIASIKVASDKATSAKIREVKSQLASLDRDIREREKSVEKSYPAYTDKIKSGADKWGWHATQLEKKKEQAVGSLRQERGKLSEALSELVGTQAASDRLVVESVANQNQAALLQFSNKKDRNMRFLGFFVVVCLAIVAFVSIMLSLIGYSDLEEMDMKVTRQPFRQAAPTSSAPPTSGPSRPDVVPVRASGGADSWEIQRRQQMAEAKIKEVERRQAEQLRQLEAQRAEEGRQNAERIRQAEAKAAKLNEERRQMEEEAKMERERADRLAREKAEAEAIARKIEAERAAAAKKASTTDKTKHLSDKNPGNLSEKLSVKVTGKGISVGGEVYGVAELSKLKDKSQKWYNRQFTSSTDKGRGDNKAKWDAIKPVWEKIGATLTYSGQKVSIEGGQLTTT